MNIEPVRFFAINDKQLTETQAGLPKEKQAGLEEKSSQKSL